MTCKEPTYEELEKKFNELFEAFDNKHQEVAKLKEDLKSLTKSGCDLLCEKEKYRTEVAKLKEELAEVSRGSKYRAKVLAETESILDEIGEEVQNNSMNNDCVNLVDNLQEILAKREESK